MLETQFSADDVRPAGIVCEVFLTMSELQQCRHVSYQQQEALIASAAKRQKVEVKLRDLTPSERKEFEQAKTKEIDQWISTETIRRITRNQVPEHQLLRTRWILTWKPVDEQVTKTTGRTHKAKARLVILGYEDPALESLPRDSPTLGRDSRMILLQLIASQKWVLRSFDISMAFLRGSKQDSRILGIEPPIEMRRSLGLREDEACELLKGAYGLVNAPLLWYIELRNALIALGFQVSPLDPCLFVLPKQNTKKQTEDPCQIHGILGIHVDDGIGGGDAIFNQTIDRLEKKFPFGSKKTQKFTFTGIQVNQESNGEIRLNQTEYIRDIPPIEIPRERRKEQKGSASQQEIQSLRGLIGSLQYAATNTRPDISCRLSLLQAKIPNATIEDLMTAKRLLDDAKRHAHVQIRIQPLRPADVRFLSFSDAAFATRDRAHSQRGTFILATTPTVEEAKGSQVSPLIWSSRKISRVVSSTLASETYARSAALDQLSWIRILWSWMLNPQVDWRKPAETLTNLPSAYAVVDCKSLYDLLQKTAVPSCSEYRTLLEALVIKDRLKEGILIKWVHSAAQMADALTKDMDPSILRTFLEQGRCLLRDVDEVLKQRSDKRLRQAWMQTASAAETHCCQCYRESNLLDYECDQPSTAQSILNRL